MSEERAFTCLQQEEIEKGRKDGLSEEQIGLYARHEFNYLQMQEIRLALEAGKDSRLIQKAAVSWVPAREMHEIFAEAETELPEIPERKKRKVPIRMIAAITSAGSLAVLLGMGLPEKRELSLELTAKEVRIPCGETFRPEKYVQACSEDAELILPEEMTADHPENRLAVYQAKWKSQEVQQILRVVFEDQEPPEISLKLNEVQSIRGAPFSCRLWLDRASDEVDGDLTDEVECSDELSDEAEQEVVYAVSDHSGNRTEAVLKVHLIELEKPSPSPEAKPAPPPVKTPVPVQTQVPEVPAPYVPPAEEYYYDVETVTETHGSDGGETSISWGG